MAKYVREFDLDAPTLQKEIRSDFRYQTRSLTSLYERSVSGKVTLGKAWKVLVEVVPEITFFHHRDLLGVLVVQVKDDPKAFFQFDEDRQKAERALQWLLDGTIKLAKELDIDESVFTDAADRVRALGFENVREWLKPCVSPGANLKADVVVDHRVGEARIVGRILDVDGSVISEHMLVSEKPDEFIFASMLGSLSWVDDLTVELRSKDGRSTWRFDAN